MGFLQRNGTTNESRAIRSASHGRGGSSSPARGELTGGGGRGSASSSELRRSSEVCAATLSSMRKRLVAVAFPGAASFSGELQLRWAAVR